MFEVIQGGGQTTRPNGPGDWRKRWAELREVERTLVIRRHGGMGPRAHFALLVGGGVGVALMACSFGLDRFGLRVPSLVFNGFPIAVAALTMYFVGKRSKRPTTWTDKLDQLLAAYDPIDREAYRRLQQRTRDLGYLESDLVHEWLGFERHAVEIAAGWRKTKPDGFLSKKV